MSSSPSFSSADHEYMALAIQCAKRGVYTVTPNPAVGCVLVRDGKIVGQGWHQSAGQAHAEVNALKEAGSEAKGATAYVTLEPCHMCAKAIVDARIKFLIFATKEFFFTREPSFFLIVNLILYYQILPPTLLV